MPQAIVDVTITPIGTNNVTISDYIAAAEKVLSTYSDLKVEIYPTSTAIEGDLDRAFKAVREMHEAAFQQGAKRVATSIRIDDRRDGVYESLQERVQIVKEKMTV